MKIVNEPKVYKIAETMWDYGAILKILEEYYNKAEWVFTSNHTGDSLCEFAGRACYGSFGEKQGRNNSIEYIDNVLKQGHGSILEHANITFFIANASRGIMSQLTRHRAGCAFSIESTHFIKYDKEVTFCLCGCEHLGDYDKDTIKEILTRFMSMYERTCTNLKMEANFKKKKLIQGIARSLLPIAIESKIIMTCNLRALRHIIELRGAEDNVPEIRVIAREMLKIAKDTAPIIFQDFNYTNSADDGYPICTSIYRKV